MAGNWINGDGEEPRIIHKKQNQHDDSGDRLIHSIRDKLVVLGLLSRIFFCLFSYYFLVSSTIESYNRAF
jgi:hypothetical protein